MAHPTDADPTINTIQIDQFRFTVLFDRLIRIEYSDSAKFEDRSTAAIIDRQPTTPNFTTKQTTSMFYLDTAYLHLELARHATGLTGLEILVVDAAGSYVGTWHGTDGEDDDNLKGTVRTLDNVDGPTPLGQGLISRKGYALFDDSQNVIIDDKKHFSPRAHPEQDLYFFGYGHDYVHAIKAFYAISGPTPLLPRFALGNWWSRYYPYTQSEYQGLFNRFAQEQVPFAVAVMDMDWHRTQVPAKDGSGWTGYSWNRSLFPQPTALLTWLHQRQLKVTLNVHPADGIRPFEDVYPAVARDMGVSTGETVKFDMSSSKFRQAYFNDVHHPLENMGVDFWWIDWQQGSTSSVAGLDPLLLLNSYHYRDIARNGGRPLILSRYAGLGSHRYPIGFSGDTHATWASLQFQPYFTATASNVGYSWWSHDIGGHMQGSRDDELTTRWLQYGVFSPINRLHSSDNLFSGKEPWRYTAPYSDIMKRYLRLRHQLVPYLYTMNVHTHEDGQPLILPLYYREPQNEASYTHPNEYYFGNSFLVAPITTPIDIASQTSSVSVYLPEGKWIDFFTDQEYNGQREWNVQRPIEDIPTFVRAGSIVPLALPAEKLNDTSNPTALEIRIFAGTSGQFTLIEDDDGVQPSEFNTDFALNWQKQPIFTIEGSGDTTVVPIKRQYTLTFVNTAAQSVTISCNGQLISVTTQQQDNRLTIVLPPLSPIDQISVQLDSDQLSSPNGEQALYRFLDRTHIDFELKQALFLHLKQPTDYAEKVQYIEAQPLSHNVKQGLLEIIGTATDLVKPR